MTLFKLTWDLHKWIGLTLSLVVLTISVTGFLLLVKKEFPSLQPPTLVGEVGEVEDFLPLSAVLAAVRGTGDPDFATVDDIDRIDFRPGKRVHKVRSRHGWKEIQVDAVTGAVLSTSWRRSDLIEAIHDGSWFAGWWHDYAMPLVALGLLFLSISGVFIWATPVLRRRRRARARNLPNDGRSAGGLREEPEES